MSLIAWLRHRVPGASRALRRRNRKSGSASRRRPRLEVLEGRVVPATTITIQEGALGSGTLDAFLFDATPGTIAAADNAGNPGTVSRGALQAVAANVDISIIAETNIV